MNRKFRVERELDTSTLRDLIITFVETPFGDWFHKVAFFRFTHEEGQSTKIPVSYGEAIADDSDFFNGSWSIEVVVENPNEGPDIITRAFGWRKLRQALEDPKRQHQVMRLLDGQYDAIDADAIIQRAVFGEVIYG